MAKWKKLNKKIAGVLMGGMMLLGTSMPAFAYVDESAEATKTEAVQTESPADTTSKTAPLPETDQTDKEEGAFSTSGTGQVQDDITDGSSKEFLTITTKNNNTFYLVIDRNATTQNVYLLSQVDENDLKDFLDEESKTAVQTPEPSVVLEEKGTSKETNKEEKPSESENKEAPKTNAGAMAAILILALGGIAGYYYFKIYRPKKQAENDFEEEGLETNDGLETINEDEEEKRE